VKPRDVVLYRVTVECDAVPPTFVRRVDAIREANRDASRTGVAHAVLRDGKCWLVVPVEHAAPPAEEDLRPILRASLARARRGR
jgi:hypothetical protein